MSIDVMKQALEALDLLAWYENPATRVQVRKPRDGGPIVTMYPHKIASEAAVALRAAIEQAQEPVAWMYHGIRHDDTPHERPSLIWKPEYMDVMSAEKGAKATPLYTTPREWVGLTDEERNNLWRDVIGWGDPSHDDEDLMKAIEAKLKEKNT